MRALSSFLFAVSSFAVACGGHVVLDTSTSASSAASSTGSESSSSAASSSASSSSSSSTSSSSSGDVDAGPTCAALVADLTEKIAAAAACTTVGTWDECDQTASVIDECGCAAPLNHVKTSAVLAAKAAAKAVVDAGCRTSCPFYVCGERYADKDFHGGCVQSASDPAIGACKWVGAD